MHTATLKEIMRYLADATQKRDARGNGQGNRSYRAAIRKARVQLAALQFDGATVQSFIYEATHNVGAK